MAFASKVKVAILKISLLCLVEGIYILHNDCLRCEDVNNGSDFLYDLLIQKSRLWFWMSDMSFDSKVKIKILTNYLIYMACNTNIFK